jgi:phospholipid/cholesterol/gamma-HCH transport system substrate-binding protein
VKAKRNMEFFVGLFVVLGLAAFVVVMLTISSQTKYYSEANTYDVVAHFDDISGLKRKAPVRVAGVSIGSVSKIELDGTEFSAIVSMRLSNRVRKIPVDSIFSVYTEGLLGSKYIAIAPGFSDAYLKENSVVERTHSAVVLEQLIGKMVFGSK